MSIPTRFQIKEIIPTPSPVFVPSTTTIQLLTIFLPNKLGINNETVNNFVNVMTDKNNTDKKSTT
jgi:hypothetical protein